MFKEVKKYHILKIFYLLSEHYMLNIRPVTENKEAIKSSPFDGNGYFIGGYGY